LHAFYKTLVCIQLCRMQGLGVRTPFFIRLFRVMEAHVHKKTMSCVPREITFRMVPVDMALREFIGNILVIKFGYSLALC